MARKRIPLFVRFVTLLTFAVLAFCFIYFFIPDLSEELFGISWNTANYHMSKVEEEYLIAELFDNIRTTYEESGVTTDQINDVIQQIDKDAMLEAVNEAIKSGANAVDVFVDTLDEAIDFGDLDTDILKQQLNDSVKNIDFSDAVMILKEYMKGGFDNLEIVVKELLD